MTDYIGDSWSNAQAGGRRRAENISRFICPGARQFFVEGVERRRIDAGIAVNLHGDGWSEGRHNRQHRRVLPGDKVIATGFKTERTNSGREHCRPSRTSCGRNSGVAGTLNRSAAGVSLLHHVR